LGATVQNVVFLATCTPLFHRSLSVCEAYIKGKANILVLFKYFVLSCVLMLSREAR
jgi:hypothetical protein